MSLNDVNSDGEAAAGDYVFSDSIMALAYVERRRDISRSRHGVQEGRVMTPRYSMPMKRCNENENYVARKERKAGIIWKLLTYEPVGLCSASELRGTSASCMGTMREQEGR